MKPLSVLVTVLAAILPAAAVRGAEFERAITLREPLGYTWTDELVHRDEKISDAGVSADTLSLHDAAGAAVPLQVEVLEGNPQAVRTVRLWWKATLPQGQAVTYRLTWNDESRKADVPGGGASVVRVGGGRLAVSVVAAGSPLTVYVPAPEGPYPRPLALGQAPPPIAEGRGRWSLEGPARVREIQTKIVAAGPVWAEVRLKYLFQGGNQSYEVTIRAVSGEPWIDVQEKTRLPAGCRMTASLGQPKPPGEAIWMPWYVDQGGRPQLFYELQHIAIDDHLKPGVPLATIRPRWTQSPADTPVVMARVGSGPAPASAAMVVGVVAVAAGDWVRPYEQFPTARPLDGREGVAIDFPLVDGQRHWGLVAGPMTEFDSKDRLERLVRRSADMPLDRVLNDWVFDWPRDAAGPSPHVLVTWPRLAQIRDDLAAGRDTPAVRLIRRAQAAAAPGEQNLIEYLLGRREQVGPPPVGPPWYLDRSYQDSLVAPAAHARELAADLARGDLAYPGRAGGDALTALVGYMYDDANFRPPATAGWDAGALRLAAEERSVLVTAAAAIPDHPASKRWMAAGLAGLHDVLRRSVVMPGGAGTESPGRTAETLRSILGAMQAARHVGAEDPFRWPETRASLECLRRLHTPPDERLGGRRDLVPMGDLASSPTDVGLVFGQAAEGLAASDAKLAGIYMAMYRGYFGNAGAGDLVRDVLAVDPSLASGPLGEASWGGRAYPGFGAVLRSAFGTPHEAFAAFKCGPSQGHYQGEELAVHFCGAATPIALDWRCPASKPPQEHMHNRVNLGDNENMDAAGELLASAFTEAGDAAVGQVRSDHLRQMPKYGNEVQPGTAYPRRTLAKEATYRRLALLVKHPAGQGGERGPMEDYLVLRDELSATEPATFNLFVLARSAKQAGQTFLFDGQLGADTAVFLATPEAGQVALDRWGWPKADESAMVPLSFTPGTDTWTGGELQQWLRVTAPPGKPFLAVVYPFRKGSAAPKFESLEGGRGVRITVGGVSESVYLATDPPAGVPGQAVIRRAGQDTVILKPGTVPPL